MMPGIMNRLSRFDERIGLGLGQKGHSQMREQTWSNKKAWDVILCVDNFKLMIARNYSGRRGM